MKTLLIVLGIIMIITPIIFILIEAVVERLPDDHRFVMWWRENVIGIGDDELF
jgi:hypothetical protein